MKIDAQIVKITLSKAEFFRKEVVTMSPIKQIKSLVVTCLILFPINVWALPAVSYYHTSGSNGYNGDNLDVRLPLLAGFFIGGGYQTYSSDLSNGTINTYKAEAGLATENDSLRAFGGVTPQVNGYKDSNVGADGRVRIFNRDNSFGDPGPRIDLIGGLNHTMITDDSIHFNEDDITGGAGVGFFKTYVKGTYTKSVYSKDVTSLPISPDKPTQIDYVPAVLEGYPDYSLTGTVTQSLLSWLDVYASYTHINFEVGATNANALSVGTQLTLFKTLVGSIQYTDYMPSGLSSSGYVSFNVGLKI
jgi:hypothetical protein